MQGVTLGPRALIFHEVVEGRLPQKAGGNAGMRQLESPT